MTILSEEPKIVFGKQQFTVKTPDGRSVRVDTALSNMFYFGDKLFIDGIFT